jgi:sugar lactone lactonase YvrE
VTTLAGTVGLPGPVDGTGAAARFGIPAAVAVADTGNVYVADAGYGTVRTINPDGVVTTLAGTASLAGYVDGTGAAARFFGPRGVAVDGTGNLYVADFGNHTIRKVTPDGVVTTLAGTAGMAGHADDTGSAARFNGPTGVAIDSTGNLYIAESFNHTIRKVTAAGVVTTLGGGAAYFADPTGVAVDGAGNVYVADRPDSTIYKIAPSGTPITVAGMAGVSRIVLGAIPRFPLPEGLAIAGDSLVIADLNAILLLRHGAQ